VVKKEIFDRLIGSLGLNGDNLSVKPLYEFSLRTFGYSKPQIFDLRKRKVIKGVKPGYVIHIRALFEVKGHKFLDGVFLLSDWKKISVKREIMDFDTKKRTVKRIEFEDFKPLENEYIRVRGTHLLATSFLTEYDPQSFIPLVLINWKLAKLIRIKFRKGEKLARTKRNIAAVVIPILPVLRKGGTFTVQFLLCPRNKDIIAEYGPLIRRYDFSVYDMKGMKIRKRNVQVNFPQELYTEIEIKSMKPLYGEYSLEVVTKDSKRRLERYEDKYEIHECNFVLKFQKVSTESNVVRISIKDEKSLADEHLCVIYCYNVS